MLKPINDKEYKKRMAIIFLSFITPILCLVFHGYEASLSSYWQTELQPLFILTNMVTAYYFFGLKRWKFPAAFLLLLTCFSVENYKIFHNILAVGFFVSVIYPFVQIQHYKWTKWFYIGSLIILPFSMMIFEMTAISIICLYHSLVLYKVNRIMKHEKKEEPIK